MIPDRVIEVAKAIQAVGGRAMLVGGCVRDEIMKLEPKDWDLEVYGVQPDKLREVLESFGQVDAVGQSFAVYKLDNEIDVAIPRRERKVGEGHRGFLIEGDPDMSFKEASSRRDFTMNAVLKDPLTGELLDFHNGLYDIDQRVLRHVQQETFIEDSLRVLRAAQFAARFDMVIDSFTLDLCRSIDLSDLAKERIREEMIKLLLSKNPKRGLEFLDLMHINQKLFPEIESLKGVQQDPIWHPEGDVFIHTGMVIEEARKLIDDLPYEEKIIVMLSALCHDFGKPSTTEMIDGRWRARGHEEAGVEPTLSFLDTLGIDNEAMRNQISAIVANHLAPAVFYKDKPSVGAFRRLANKVRLDLLCLVSEADVLGRNPIWLDKDKWTNNNAHVWFRERIANLNIEKKGPDSLLMGRHLIELGLKPSKQFGDIIKQVYEKQLDGEINTVEEAINEAKEILNAET